jgi:lipopolysaccharide export system permease protein
MVQPMKKLTAYISRLFATDAVILFVIACFLLWLVNCLRQFDVVSVKGQGFGTLAVQALYTMPPLALAFFYICIGIGIVRALAALQNSHELHIIHSSGGLKSLFRATTVVCTLSVIAVMFLAHILEPMANRKSYELQAAVAADLVSSTLKPNRFTQATPGVVLLIGGREGSGLINEFYADDRRDPGMRRTYIAETARVMGDGENYFLELRDGKIENLDATGRYSEVRFARYELGIDTLSQQSVYVDKYASMDSLSMIREALETGDWNSEIIRHLTTRSAEGLRVIGLCVLVVAISGFPSGKRTRFKLPMEAVVMLIAFGERGMSAYSPWGVGTGGVVLFVVGVLVFAFKVWPRRITRDGVPA